MSSSSFSPGIQAAIDRMEAVFPQRLVALGAQRQVAWREAGDGESDFAYVCLHGISSSAASWFGVAERLLANARVLAWDAPGYGESTPLSVDAPTDADYARVLGESLAALGVRRCVLVGHSLGCLVAARWACDASALQIQIRQLVLMSPAGGYGAPAKAEQRSRVMSGRVDALRDQGVSGIAAVIDQRLCAPGAPGPAREWVRWNASRMRAGGYLQAVHLLCSGDLGEASGRLTMPVHVWVGTEDVVTTPEASEAWARRLGAQYVTLAKAGHACVVEQPEKIAQMLAHLS